MLDMLLPMFQSHSAFIFSDCLTMKIKALWTAKCREQHTQWHNATSKKKPIFNNTNVRTSNLATVKFLLLTVTLGWAHTQSKLISSKLKAVLTADWLICNWDVWLYFSHLFSSRLIHTCFGMHPILILGRQDAVLFYVLFSLSRHFFLWLY